MSSRTRAALRRLVHRATNPRPGGDADVYGVIRSFSAIEVIGPAPPGLEGGTIRASLVASGGRTLRGIDVDITQEGYRLAMPVERLARCGPGTTTFELWLESGSRRWRVARRRSSVRGPVTVPNTVLHDGQDSIRIRITSDRQGSLMVQSASLAAA